MEQAKDAAQEPALEIKVTKIKNRWHARLKLKDAVLDEMACDNREDIGFISRTMLRWYDKVQGNSAFAHAARQRLNKEWRSAVGNIWWQGELRNNKARKDQARKTV